MKDGGPAFPDYDHNGVNTGMSMRDYFAAAALAHPYTQERDRPDLTNATAAAGWAYVLADAMLAAREKT
jgi:hypothetical protein